ncbi:MAG: CopG family ribbon-helix-helix protein [Candidatus Micrarchaeota archaeon]
MAKIISISLDEQMLTTIDELTKNYEFKGRSEAVRAAVGLLQEEKKTLGNMRGVIEAVITIIHPEKTTKTLFEIMHSDQRFVKSHIHSHLNQNNCFDLLVLKGEAREIEKIVKKLKREKNAKIKVTIL